MASAVSEVSWLQSLLRELNNISPTVPSVWCDNQSTVLLAANPVLHARTKHIKIDLYFVRDKVLQRHIQVKHVPAQAQIADCLTKPISSSRFSDVPTKLSSLQGSNRRIEYNCSSALIRKRLTWIQLLSKPDSVGENSEPLQGSLKLSWNAIKGWKWKEIEGGIIQFTFANRNDALNVLSRRPWFVCGYLLIIMSWPAWLTPSEVRFDKTPLWVNVESIPPFYWNRSNLKELASKASPVHELPLGIEDVVGLSTLRFRATIDLNKPIFSGFFLRRQKLKDLWIQYRYERLPKLCFKYGMLTHDQSICFKAPTVIKDDKGNFYPMFDTWLKHEAKEKSTFTSPLAKWFQDWTLQKQLGHDPVLRNQFKIHKAILHGESDELRECRLQLPAKKQIVSDEESGVHQPEVVITQIPLVRLPGIGEFAPFGENSKVVVIQDLKDAAPEKSPDATNEKPQSSASRDAEGSESINASRLGIETTDGHTSLGEANKVLECVPTQNDHLGEKQTTGRDPSSTPESTDTCGPSTGPSEDLNGKAIPYSSSILGTQAQLVDWPSTQCWAEPQAPCDGLTFYPSPKARTSSGITSHLNGPHHPTVQAPGESLTPIPPSSSSSTIPGVQETLVSSVDISSRESYSPGSSKRRGRPRGRKNIVPNEPTPQKRRGRPPKKQCDLSPSPKIFKWTKKSPRPSGSSFTVNHSWEGKEFDLKINLSNHFVVVEKQSIPRSNFRQLAALVRLHNPEMVLISETRLTEDRFGVDCTIRDSNKNNISCVISSDLPGNPWHLLGMYGPPHGTDKEAFWLKVGDFTLNCQEPLLMIGDMNGTLKDSECVNYANQGNSSRYAFDFRRMVNRAGLVDLGFQGLGYTWSKGRNSSSQGGGVKRARLDRGLASIDWRIMFPNAIVHHLAASEKFEELFKKNSSCDPSILASLFHQEITNLDNRWLNAIPDRDEISSALAEMGKDKAPGPDGLPPSFFNHHWDTIHADLIEMVIHFFRTCELPKFINDTSFVLVPKKDGPAFTNDYRPIALCNVAYKIISKTIANRLRGFLPQIISPNQAAFVKGRHIAENTMLAKEIVHSMNRRRGKGGFMMIKIDMEKAYDKLDWDFIVSVLAHFGFPDKFIQWIKACISVEEIKQLLNGVAVGQFKPERGLRQGDPLSPSLFIMAAETLSRLILLKEQQRLIKGFKMGRRGISLSHLMFANDLVLLGQASLGEAKEFLDCLNTYCQCSGQSVNIQKSSIYFSKGVTSRDAQAISQCLGMKRMSRQATYLGLPLFRSLKRTNDTQYLVDRVSRRVQGWKSKLLSSAGKACLIKSVGSTISNYVAASDVIPTTIANKIDRLLRDFWWGDSELKRRLHTVAWETLCKPKVSGGLGFRTTEATNKTFLMKWAWKLLTSDDSLWYKTMEAKYFPYDQFLDVGTKLSDSLLWKAILKARDLTPSQLWVEDAGGVSLVSNFINNNTWDENLMNRWFHEDDARRIINITLPSRPVQDSWLWMSESNGNFSIKSAYRTIKNLSSTEDSSRKWKTIWGAKIHNRLKMFWWKILSDSLLTRGKLGPMLSLPDTSCPLCSRMVELSFHLFWDCPYARVVWFGCSWQVRTDVLNIHDWETWLNWFATDAHRPSNVNYHLFLGGAAIIFQSIWRARNVLIHDKKSTPPPATVTNINNRIVELLNAHSNPTNQLREWLPPPVGWLTCNTDIAISTNHSAGAAIFRDHNGQFKRIYTFKCQHCDSLAGEVAALYEGAAAAVKLGFNNVIFQSDSSNAIEAILLSPQDIKLLHHNIQEIVSKFHLTVTQLNLWEACWIPRSCNRVAHFAAQEANRNLEFGQFDSLSVFGSLQSPTVDGHDPS
uniref:Reverse transcriptase domain-containing protein n=1 Tax=Cannabis sativa TaxID=3483 RepID=A0A803P2D8_CANSA